MRKITAGFFISLDGVVEAPDKWHMSYFNEEMGEVVGGAMQDADANLFGRVNYLAQQEAWAPQGDANPFSQHLNSVRKYVVSDSLESADWNNSVLIRGENAAAELRRLKAQDGKNISVYGSAILVRWLIKEGLLDELNLMIHPVVVGHGQRLFEADDQVSLRLIDSRTFKTGVISATYQPEGK
jgi:dihydrofolate reductase